MDELQLRDSNASDRDYGVPNAGETDLSEIIGSFLGSIETQMAESASEREDATPRTMVNGAMLYSASAVVAGLLLLASVASGIAIRRLRQRES